jgi:uncharacterized membrane protein
MIREHAQKSFLVPERNFRWRATEITRLEGFTDAVFAFAVTLLVVSLEVPKTYSELLIAMKGFVAFAICFAILVWIWHEHYIFSRRYGLQTGYTVFLNSVLLFVALFYVYPLKFVFTVLVGSLTSGATLPGKMDDMINIHQAGNLMMIYSLGFTAVFAVFALLYGYAYRHRAELDLNEYETLVTRKSIVDHTAMAVLGILIAIIAKLLPPNLAGGAGYLYVLIGVYHGVSGTIYGKKEKLALERVNVRQSASGV